MKEIIEKNIKNKANEAEHQFFKEFNNFLNKYRLSESIKFEGLEGYFKEKDDKRDEWRDRLSQIFINRETQEMLNKLNYMEDYFKGGE